MRRDNRRPTSAVVFAVAVGLGLPCSQLGCHHDEGADKQAVGLSDDAARGGGENQNDSLARAVRAEQQAREQANRDAALRYPGDMMKVQEAWRNDDPEQIRKLLTAFSHPVRRWRRPPRV